MDHENADSPTLSSLLKFNFLGLHEAAFLLTEWPREGYFECSLSPLPEEIKKDRSFFYMPHKLRLNFESMHSESKRAFIELKKSIELGELPARSEYLFEGVSLLVNTEDLILWALFKGFILSKELQRELGFGQIKNPKENGHLPNKVKNKIVGQFVLSMEPNLKLAAEIYKHPLMQLFKEEKKHENGEPTDKEHKAVLRSINKLYNSAGKRGRPAASCSPPNRLYVPKAIPEVMLKDDKGRVYYHFPLFKVAMELAAHIKMTQLGKERLLKISKSEFMNELLNDDVVFLYLENAPQIVLKFTLKCFELVLLNYWRLMTPLVGCGKKNLSETIPPGKLPS